jgi:hypothetical protein
MNTLSKANIGAVNRRRSVMEIRSGHSRRLRILASLTLLLSPAAIIALASMHGQGMSVTAHDGSFRHVVDGQRIDGGLHRKCIARRLARLIGGTLSVTVCEAMVSLHIGPLRAETVLPRAHRVAEVLQECSGVRWITLFDCCMLMIHRLACCVCVRTGENNRLASSWLALLATATGYSVGE